MSRPEQDRILIIISDGSPAGRRSTTEDLEAAAASLASRPDMELFALGLGPTDHVVHFYGERGRDGIPVERYADEIGALLGKTLLGGLDESWARENE